MDYEKKYKEALEKARQLCAYPTTKPFINDLQDLFPELAESEDEKTRKRIIALVNAHGQGIYKGDMLTWLENIPYTIDHEKREGFHLGYKAALEKQGELVNSLSKGLDNAHERIDELIQKNNKLCIKLEQKAEWKQENVEELSEFENAMMHIGYSFFGKRGGLDPNDTSSVKVQAQYLLELAQKTAWSEEDKKMIGRIRGIIEAYAFSQSAVDVNGDLCEKKFIDVDIWLKSLKERIGG